MCDFGGSLGSTYFQNKKFLDGLDQVSWSIVEQKHFVDIGKEEFADHRLKFYHSVDECVKNDFEYILIDRTSFSRGNENIKLQIVPPTIYEASYPCRFFDEAKFISHFEKNDYRIIEDFDALDGKNDEYEFKGFIMEKTNV